MALIAKITVSNRNADGTLKTYLVGTQIEGLSETEEKRLIKCGAAERVSFVKASEETSKTDGQLDFHKILDEEFNATELKEVAKDAGLDFLGNISKENLIKQIIEEGKVTDIIEIEEEK